MAYARAVTRERHGSLTLPAFRTRGAAPMAFLAELASFLLARKKFWMLPIFAAMVALGGLVVFAKGSAVAPFIYTLF
jgi:Family of unknown function (DUF5989)